MTKTFQSTQSASLLENIMIIFSTHFHAMLVRFPHAFLTVGFLFESIYFFFKNEFFCQSGFYLLILGMLGTVGSYLTGNAAGEGIEVVPLNQAMGLHELAAAISLWLTIIITLVYGGIYFFKYKRIVVRRIAVVHFAGVKGSNETAGYLGGQLMYKQGADGEFVLPDFSNSDEK